MSQIIATTLSNGSVSVPTATVVNGSAKAWVNFNGTGTIAARDSFNVASLTDGGVGIYTVNLTNSLSDANYFVGATAGIIVPAGLNRHATVQGIAAASFGVGVRNAATNANEDSDLTTANAHGDLA